MNVIITMDSQEMSPSSLQMIEESDFEAVISQYEEEVTSNQIQDLRRKLSMVSTLPQNPAKVPSTTPALVPKFQHILSLLTAEDLESATETWKELDFAPIPGEDWENTYTWLQRIALFREERFESRVSENKNRVSQLERTIRDQDRSLSELKTEIQLLKSGRSRPSKDPSSESLVLRAQLSNLSKAIESRDSEIRDFRQELTFANSEIQRLTVLNTHWRMESRLSNTHPNAFSEGDGNEDVIRLLREVQELKEERREMKKNLDDGDRLREIIREREGRIEELERKGKEEGGTDERQRDQTSLELALSDIKAKKKYIQDLETHYEEDLERLRSLLSVEKQQKEVAEAEGKKLRKELEAEKDRNLDMEAHIRVLDNQGRSQSELRISLLTSELAEVQVAYSQASSTNADLKSRMSALEQLSKTPKTDLESQEANHTLQAQSQEIRLLQENAVQLKEKIAAFRLAETQRKEEVEQVRLDKERLRQGLETAFQRNDGLQAELNRFAAALEESKRAKGRGDKEKELEENLKAVLTENEGLFARLKEMENTQERLDEASTELEILKQEHSICHEEAREHLLELHHLRETLEGRLQSSDSQLQALASEHSLSLASLRLKEEEIVQLSDLISQYQRQIQDCQSLLIGQLPQSKTAKAYAEGLAEDWNLIGKIEAQIQEIETERKRVEMKDAEIYKLKEEMREMRMELERREEKERELERNYKEKLTAFKQDLDSEKQALQRSHEELAQKARALQTDLKRYVQQKELDQSVQRDSEMDSTQISQFAEEIKRLNDASRRSLTSVSALAEFMESAYEDWRTSLKSDVRASVKTRKIANGDDVLSDLAAIKAFFSSFLADLSHVFSQRSAGKTAGFDYETTLDFAQKLLSRLDSEEGGIEAAIVVQLIRDKLILEQEMAKKSEQLFSDERFFTKSDQKSGGESREQWVTARWQSSEQEVYRLRSQLMENSKRLEDFFSQKTAVFEEGDIVQELRNQVKILRGENKEKNAKLKEAESAKADQNQTKAFLTQKASFESLISDMRAQQTQLKAGFEAKERAWKDAIKGMQESLQTRFLVDEDTLGKMDFTGSPGSFISVLSEAIISSKSKSQTQASELQQTIVKHQAELDSWQSRQEAWISEKEGLTRIIDRAHAETDRFKSELTTTKEFVEKLMAEMTELSRKARDEIPQENFARGVQEGELKAKKEQKRLKMVIGDYRDQLEQMKVKYEGLQDQVLALTAQSAQLTQEKDSLHEEARTLLNSRLELARELRKTKSNVLDRTKTDADRSQTGVQSKELEFEPLKRVPTEVGSQNSGSLQLSFSRETPGIKPNLRVPKPADIAQSLQLDVVLSDT